MTTERLVTEYTSDTRGFRRGAREYDQTLARQERLTNDRLTRIDRRWERSTRSILQTRTALVGLSGFVGGAALNQLRSYAEQWRDVERSLQSIGVTSVEKQRDLVDLAIRTRSSVTGTADAVQRMAKSTGDGIELTTRRVETLQKLLAYGGATGSERASVSLQLGQALKSGRLAGDEYRSISENAPVEFLDALARAAGIARKDLKDFAKEQKLTTNIVLEALDSLAATADEKFGSLAISGEEAFNVLSAGLVAYVGNVDKSLGATETINSAMAFLGEYMADSGEGAETMAQSIKLVGAVALATAGSRGLGALNKSFRDAAESRRLTVTAAQAESRASRQAVIDAQTELAAKKAIRRERELDHQRQIFNDRATVQSGKRRRAAIVAEEQALNRLKVAQARARASTTALTVAQSQLSAAYRLGAASVRAFNGVMAFFGGPIGLAITSLTLFVALMSQVKSPVEKLDGALSGLSVTMGKLEGVNTSLKADYDALEQANLDLAEAIKTGGEAAVAAATLDVDSIQKRIKANEAYRKELSSLARLELAEAKSILAKIEAEEESSARRRMAVQRDRAGHANQIRRLAESYSTEEVQQFIQAEREMVLAADEAGTELTDQQRKVLESAKAHSEAAIQVADLEDKVKTLTAAAPGLTEGLEDASETARQLAADAAAAQAGIAGLISVIPELQRAAQIQAKISKAQADRNAALKGVSEEGLSVPERIAREKKIIDLYERAVSEIDGTAQATRDASKALKDYTDKSHLNSLTAREQAVVRERKAYDQLRASLVATGATEEQLRSAELAHQQNLATIKSRFDKKDTKAGASAAKEAESDLAAARDLLVQNGQKALFIEVRLNEERQRLLELLPALIELGLSSADAQAVINSELERTETELKRVRSASEEAAYQFARGILEDIRHAENLGDAIGNIAKRLTDLATDKAFDALAEQFANLFSGSGNSGTGFFSTFIGLLFGGGASSGNSAGVEPAVLHSGGVVGRSGYGHGRVFSPKTWAGAPRYHSGGVAGLRPGELPAILEQGEVVIPKNVLRKGRVKSGSGGLTVVIHNAPEGDHRVEASDDGRKLDVFLERRAIAAVTSPKGKKAMLDTYGIKSKAAGV